MLYIFTIYITVYTFTNFNTITHIQKIIISLHKFTNFNTVIHIHNLLHGYTQSKFIITL